MKGATFSDRDREAIDQIGRSCAKIRSEMAKRIVGQEEVMDQFLVAFFAGGHCLLMGVPGLAKTLMVKSLSEVLSLSFSRIQFTPDLLPSDITGTEMVADNPETGERELRFLRGPLFANVVLADEINRTPPKTQAALLEAMEEGTISCGGRMHRLERPFYVLATQNPIEQEGTYPLPAAAMDRFMFEIYVGYPGWEEEKQIVRRTLPLQEVRLNKVLDRQEIVECLGLVRRLPVSEEVYRFATDLVRATRPSSGKAPPLVKDFVNWGGSPRGVQCLVLGAKARALIQGRSEVKIEDVVEVALPVLRHRLILNYHAQAEGVDADRLIRRVVNFLLGRPDEEVAPPPRKFWGRLAGWWGRPASQGAPAV
jgi:MoxR-like ATPase